MEYEEGEGDLNPKQMEGYLLNHIAWAPSVNALEAVYLIASNGPLNWNIPLDPVIPGQEEYLS